MIYLVKITLCESSFHDVGWTRDEVDQKNSFIYNTNNTEPTSVHACWFPFIIVVMNDSQGREEEWRNYYQSPKLEHKKTAPLFKEPVTLFFKEPFRWGKHGYQI
jgi:hypothetical protein